MRYSVYSGVIQNRSKTQKILLAVAGLAFTAAFALSSVIPALARGGGGGDNESNYIVVSSNNENGWTFNPDPVYATPYEFNYEQASVGNGSLEVEPIGSTPAHKFIAAKTMGIPVADLNSIAYDFLIAGDGTASDAAHFYLNVYTNLPSSATFYDCRFDYVPATGSTASFTTAMFSSTDVPADVADRPDMFTCPATLAGMPAGSTISFVALNVGDTSTNDVGLGGYLDKAVFDTVSSVTTYDFEPPKVQWQYVGPLNAGEELNKQACANLARNPKLVDVTQTIENDIDSGVTRPAWAEDNYTRSIKIFKTNQPNVYCAVLYYDGVFETFVGDSPQGTGNIPGGLQGTMVGGYRAIITGTYNPSKPTSGYIGNYDYGCDSTGACTNRVDWTTFYFDQPISGFDFEWWGWKYVSNEQDHKSRWINACEGPDPDCPGNSGDIL